MIDELAELKWPALFLYVGGTEPKRAKTDQSDHFNN